MLVIADGLAEIEWITMRMTLDAVFRSVLPVSSLRIWRYYPGTKCVNMRMTLRPKVLELRI